MRTFLGLDLTSRRRAHKPPRSHVVERIRIALFGLTVVIALGTLGYWSLPLTQDGHEFSPLEALYQTVTTVATVGFREVHPFNSGGEVFTILLIILGAGTVLYNLGLLVEAVTEGHLLQHLERRRMDKDIAALRGHVIVCGYGRVGRAAAEELAAVGRSVVVIDKDASRLADTAYHFLLGDVVAADELLIDAGIHHAQALIIALDTDAETVYLTLSARALAPKLMIIARARTVDSKEKLVLAGATRAFNPQLSGGRRMAAFATQPLVTEFLDEVMHNSELDYAIQQVEVGQTSSLVGQRVSDGVGSGQVLAVRRPGAESFTFRPDAQHVIEAGSVLIVFGVDDDLDRLRQAPPDRPA